MRVLVKNGFCLGGGRDVGPGEHIELSEDEATIKIARGWVVPDPIRPGPSAVPIRPIEDESTATGPAEGVPVAAPPPTPPASAAPEPKPAARSKPAGR